MINDNEDKDRYNDIIGLPHHVSSTHPHMKRGDRAAQFAPFAALTGFGAAITETARYTDERAELDEAQKELLNNRLMLAAAPGHPAASITYFQPDERKSGGTYVTAVGAIKKLDGYERTVTLTDGRVIPLDDIFDVTLE